MRYARIRIGDWLTVNGEKARVMDISCEAYSDMGCGPVFDITTIECEKKNGSKLTVKIEEGVSNER